MMTNWYHYALLSAISSSPLSYKSFLDLITWLIGLIH
jgi:hypothetical protein